MNARWWFVVVMSSVSATATETIISLTEQTKIESTVQLRLHVGVPAGDALYHDHLHLGIDHPDITLVSWHANVHPIEQYDALFKSPQKKYLTPFTMQVIVRRTAETHPEIPHLHCTWYQKSAQRMMHASFPLTAFAAACQPTPVNELLTGQTESVRPTTAPPERSALDRWVAHLDHQAYAVCIYGIIAGTVATQTHCALLAFLITALCLCCSWIFYMPTLMVWSISMLCTLLVAFITDGTRIIARHHTFPQQLFFCFLGYITFMTASAFGMLTAWHIRFAMLCVLSIFVGAAAMVRSSREKAEQHFETVAGCVLVAAAFPLLFMAVKAAWM